MKKKFKIQCGNKCCGLKKKTNKTNKQPSFIDNYHTTVATFTHVC
jgi:hypothetical protein